MLTEDQFNKFMNGIQQNQAHWELLIRIDENTKNMKLEAAKHYADDSGEFALTKSSLSKVHGRIDVIDNDIQSVKNRLIGAFTLATLIISFVQVGLSFYNSSRTAAQFKVERAYNNANSFHNA